MNSEPDPDRRSSWQPGQRLSWVGWGAGVAFLVLGVRMTLNPDPSTVDRAVTGTMARLEHPTVRTVAWVFCWPGEGRYRPAALCVLLTTGLVLVGAGKWGAVFGLASGLAGATSVAVKYLVGRQRPIPDGTAKLVEAYSPSFPSGHVAFYGAMFLVVALAAHYGVASPARRRLIGALCMLGVVVTGAARLYLQVHWFSDVLGGACLAVWAAGVVTGLAMRRWPANGRGEADPGGR